MIVWDRVGFEAEALPSPERRQHVAARGRDELWHYVTNSGRFVAVRTSYDATGTSGNHRKEALSDDVTLWPRPELRDLGTTLSGG
jgi:hypothetical protein